ncbi:MAG: glycosyltransferase family 2 protein [Promethearchaeota archaeon]
MLSVVIPTKFERSNLENCIKSINNQVLKPDEILVIATLNEMKKIKEIEKKFNIKVFIEKRAGLSYSRNLGILKSKGDIIAFIDDDAIAHKKWLYYISKSHKLKDVGVVGGRIKPIWHKNVPQIIKNSLLAKEWLSLVDLASFPFYVDRVIGCNFSLKREVFNQIGAFDTSIGKYSKLMYGGEETEFCERAGKKYKILYSPKSVVYHNISNEKLRLKWFIQRAHDSGFSKAKRKRLPKILARNPKFNIFDYFLISIYLVGYIKGKISKL